MADFPTIIMIFGGAGDLTWRKLIPSLFDLHRDGHMPTKFAIIAVDRLPFSDARLRSHFLNGAKQFSRGKVKSTDWSLFARHVSYHQGDFEDPATYASLEKKCAGVDKEWGQKSGHIFHMAVPPAMVGIIPKLLADAGLNRNRLHDRIVVEKPIGHDLESAREMNRTLRESFYESQIFRIDHYLGKETVQNILAFRFANPLFEPIWDRRYVEYVTLTVAEEVGVGHRGGYYEHAGALRDMVQNHLMKLLCLVAMEPMVSFEADEIRNKKVDVLHAVRPIHAEAVSQCAVRGQYRGGSLHGKKVPGYRREDGVSSRSKTETFAALKLYIDNWRWQGVPFYLRTGKRLRRQFSEIAIQFRSVPHRSFPPEASRDWHPSRLVLSIQPEEGIVLGFQAKYPGSKILLRPVEMRFSYEESFSVPSPDAYETLLRDVMNNDSTLFMRADQVEAAWEILMPVLDSWAKARPVGFPNYAPGTWGPAAADALLARDGHEWRPVE